MDASRLICRFHDNSSGYINLKDLSLILCSTPFLDTRLIIPCATY